MMKAKRFILAALFAVTVGGAALSVTAPVTAQAACNDHFLTFPAWFRGLIDDKCEIQKPGSGQDGLSNFIWTIVLNIVEAALQAVAYVSLIFLLYGGFKFIYGAGSPDQIVGARKTILNAVIGLVISMFAVLIVNLVVVRL